jgi:hypothetical protein
MSRAHEQSTGAEHRSRSTGAEQRQQSTGAGAQEQSTGSRAQEQSVVVTEAPLKLSTANTCSHDSTQVQSLWQRTTRDSILARS